MEKIDITTRFSREGKLIPLDFTLGDEVIGILNIGRQWDTYHLFFNIPDLSWYVIKDLKGSVGKV